MNSLAISLDFITRGLEVLENVKDYLLLGGNYNLTAEFLNKLKASHIELANNDIFSDVSLLVGRPRSKVSIDACPLVVDLSPLSKIKSVELWYMDGITDVSALSKCDEVYLHSLKNITDVSALQNVSKLTLVACHLITDVSMLSHIPVLSIKNCRGIINWGDEEEEEDENEEE